MIGCPPFRLETPLILTSYLACVLDLPKSLLATWSSLRHFLPSHLRSCSTAPLIWKVVNMWIITATNERPWFFFQPSPFYVDGFDYPVFQLNHWTRINHYASAEATLFLPVLTLELSVLLKEMGIARCAWNPFWLMYSSNNGGRPHNNSCLVTGDIVHPWYTTKHDTFHLSFSTFSMCMHAQTAISQSTQF